MYRLCQFKLLPAVSWEGGDIPWEAVETLSAWLNLSMDGVRAMANTPWDFMDHLL